MNRKKLTNYLYLSKDKMTMEQFSKWTKWSEDVRTYNEHIIDTVSKFIKLISALWESNTTTVIVWFRIQSGKALCWWCKHEACFHLGRNVTHHPTGTQCSVWYGQSSSLRNINCFSFHVFVYKELLNWTQFEKCKKLK